MSFTKLRNILKDPNATLEQQLAVWEQGFDVNKLGQDWILHLMDLTRKGMGIKTDLVIRENWEHEMASAILKLIENQLR
jgi:hypothetical protein